MSWSWFHRRVTRIGDYEIVEKIGQGGTGDVFKAKDPRTDAPVAIKILSRDLADHPVLFKRFEQEFQITRALQHPHVVRSFDFGVDGDIPYLVMEFIEGITLWQLIREKGRLALVEAMKLLQPIAEVLQLAHDNGLIHRDVKPDNILIDENGQSKLTDFGLVKDLQTNLNLTDSATALGTPNFMAPEQFQDSKRADHRCDIYGLAATFYMAVTGIVPFGAQGGLSILKKKMNGDIVPPRQLIPELPLAFEWNLMRALRIARDERPDSCADFIAKLKGDVPPVEAETEPESQKTEERRGSPRFACDLNSKCAPFDHRNSTPLPAKIVDVSTGGMAMILSRRYERKNILRVVLPFAEPLGPQPVYVRVSNVAATDSGAWRLGCQFTNELGGDDLQLLLEELPRLREQASEVRAVRSDEDDE